MFIFLKMQYYDYNKQILDVKATKLKTSRNILLKKNFKTQNQECNFMKRKLLIILSIIILIIGGYFILNEYKKKRLVNEAQEKAEEYLKENYDDIESVQVTPDNYRFKPMGTLGIGG